MASPEEEFPGAAQCAADLAKIGVEAGYRAGLLAGLREAAEKLEAQAADADRFADICEQDGDRAFGSRGAAMALRSAAKEFRARIAALEEEAGR